MDSRRALLKALFQMEVKAKVWQLIITVILPAIFTFLVGWMLFGWLLFPVVWKPNQLKNAPYTSQVIYVHLVSEWYAYTAKDEQTRAYLNEVSNPDMIACSLAAGENSDMGKKARYIKLAYLVNGNGCTQ